MVDEIFGPVLTVYVYEDADYEKTLDLIDTTTGYALTGSMYVSSLAALILCPEADHIISYRMQFRCGPPRTRAGDEPTAQRGRERLLQREVHGRRRRAAAVRRGAGQRHERQGGLHLDLLPLRVRAQHQGELRRAREPPLPLEPRVGCRCQNFRGETRT